MVLKSYFNMIACVAVAVPFSPLYDYLIPPTIEKDVFYGQRVLVPFGPRYIIGVVISVKTDSEYESLKEIQDIVTPQMPLPSKLMDFISWIAQYYLISIGQVCEVALPSSIRPSFKTTLHIDHTHAFWNTLTEEEKEAIFAFNQKTLLQIKKTESYKIYLSLFKEAQKQGAFSFQTYLQEYKIPLAETWLYFNDSLKPEKLTKNEQIVCDCFKQHNNKIRKKEVSKLLPISNSNKLAIIKKLCLLSTLEEKDEFPPKKEITYNSSAFQVLTEAQNKAFLQIKQAIHTNKFSGFLLHGVTGSGKTEVYLQATKEALLQNKKILFIVPEIILISQIITLFQLAFGENIAILHAQLSDLERSKEWWRIYCGYASIVIGARSALFAPIDNIGLIIVDEEHDSSYKQHDILYHHARDSAVQRAVLNKATIILGSATPSIESYYNSLQKKYTLLELPERINNQVDLHWHIVDLQDDRVKKVNGSFYLSYKLYEKMREVWQNKKQVLLFLNRRGFATVVTCNNESCKTPIFCKNCSITMTWHKKKEILVCHYCGYTIKKPKACPVCKSKSFREEGIGTQRVEQDIQALFPRSKVLRVDRDTTSTKQILENTMQQLKDNDFDFLIGTQMISKGHDFQNIGLVCVLFADIGLTLPDFRASEKTFQLLSQVSGRAGRGSQLKSEIWIQSYNPQHPAIIHALQNNYSSFFQYTLEQRQIIENPPFTRQILIRISDPKEGHVIQAANQIYQFLQKANKNNKTFITKPIIAPINRLKNRYYWYILVKTKDIKTVKKQLFFLFWKQNWRTQAHITLDVDPYNFL